MPGHNANNSGQYGEALGYFKEAVKIAPAIEVEIYPHLIICQRVLGIERLRRRPL